MMTHIKPNQSLQRTANKFADAELYRYKEEYLRLIREILQRAVAYYGERLVSFALFGSVARDRFRPDSDIDIMLVVENLERGRVKRVEEFSKNIEEPLKLYFNSLRQKGIYPDLSPVIKTPEEVSMGSPIFLDMVDDAKILFDREGFFRGRLDRLKEKLRILGSKKITFKGGYYWILKPDYKTSEIIEL